MKTGPEAALGARLLDLGRRYGPSAVGLLLSAAFCVRFLGSRDYLFAGTDPYYYISIVDNLLGQGVLASAIEDPASPPATPQNGMVFVYLALRGLGLSPAAQLAAVTLLYWLAWVSAVYPFVRLAQRAGVEGYWPLAALTTGFLAAGHLLDYQLIPATDGFFQAGATWWVYGVDRLLLRRPPADGLPPRFAAWAGLILAPLVLIQFRMNMVTYLIAAILCVACLPGNLSGKLRPFATLALVLLLSIASVALACQFMDTSGLAKSTGVYCQAFRANASDFGFFLFRFSCRHLTRLLPLTHTLAFLGLLLVCFFLGWRRSHGTLSWLAVAGAVLMALVMVFPPSALASALPHWKMRLAHACTLAMAGFLGFCLRCAWRREDPLMAFAALLLVGSFLFALTTPAGELIRSAPRITLGAVPFLWLLAMRFRWTQPLAYAAIAIGVWDTVDYQFPKKRPQWFVEYLADARLRLPADAVLVSQDPRETYFWLHGRHQTDLPLAVLRWGVRRVWIAGDREFRDRYVAQLEGFLRRRVTERRWVTEGFEDAAGTGILELTLHWRADP